MCSESGVSFLTSKFKNEGKLRIKIFNLKYSAATAPLRGIIYNIKETKKVIVSV